MTLENKLNEWLVINTVCLIFNLVGHIYLVPLKGIDGAIGSYIASQILGNVLMSLVFKSSRKSLLMFMKVFTFPLRVTQKIK